MQMTWALGMGPCFLQYGQHGKITWKPYSNTSSQSELFPIRQALISKLDREALTPCLLPARFTLTQVQKVYEAVEGQQLDKRNLQRSILAWGWIRETGALERGNRRPARLYELAK